MEGHIQAMCDAARRAPPEVVSKTLRYYYGSFAPILGLFFIHQGSFAPILLSRSPRECQDPLVLVNEP